MKAIKIILFLILIGFLLGFTGNNNPPSSVIGKTVNDFSLKSTNNTLYSLNKFKTAKGFIIVFTCNHCPFARLYTKRLNDLNTKYIALGVPLLAINSMDSVMYEEETFESMERKVLDEKIKFPYLQDADQSVGKNFNASRTPQAYIIWKETNNWVIKYSGAIDDNGEHSEKATPFLVNALEELLKGRPVSDPENPSIGCRINYRK